jgi:hypothetical protein
LNYGMTSRKLWSDKLAGEARIKSVGGLLFTVRYYLAETQPAASFRLTMIDSILARAP